MAQLHRFAVEAFRSHIVLKATSEDHAIKVAQRLFHSTTGPLAAEQIKVRILNETTASGEATNPEVMSKSIPKAEKARVEKLIAKKAVKAAKPKPTLGDRVEKKVTPKATADKAPKAAKPAKAVPSDKPGKAMSGLDAAAKVLEDGGIEMNAKEIVAAIKAKGLADGLKGATPHATIYAAMITEISKKEEKSRFVRGSAKGTFAFNPQLDAAK